MSYIFLSHSHEDKPFTRRLAADLRNAGHAVWIDEAEINIGDSLVQKLREGIDQVDYVVAVISEHSVQSPWVQRELDIATNREIEENKVIVLPAVLSQVELPGFLKGKFYGDFTDPNSYEESLGRLLRALGRANPLPHTDADELAALKAELAVVQAVAERHEKNAARAAEAAFHAKSPELQIAIEKAANSFPEHDPINRTHAFQIGNTVVTLDYLLWAIGKEARKGFHPLSALVTLENRWPDVERMFDAYRDMLDQRR